MNQKPDMTDPRTTREKLTALGYTTENAGQYRKRVLMLGVEVFKGTAWEIECWLASSQS